MALRQSAGDLAAALLSIVRTRLELFSLEASGQKAQLMSMLALAFGALLFATLAILVFSIALALFFWPTDHRYTALFCLALAYLVVALALFWYVRRRLTQAPLPFSATLEELKRDVALVESLREPSPARHRHTHYQEPS